MIKRKTAKSRFRRALHAIWEWCRKHLHDPVRDQHRQLRLKLQGHYAYYGITGNSEPPLCLPERSATGSGSTGSTDVTTPAR